MLTFRESQTHLTVVISFRDLRSPVQFGGWRCARSGPSNKLSRIIHFRTRCGIGWAIRSAHPACTCSRLEVSSIRPAPKQQHHMHPHFTNFSIFHRFPVVSSAPSKGPSSHALTFAPSYYLLPAPLILTMAPSRHVPLRPPQQTTTETNTNSPFRKTPVPLSTTNHNTFTYLQTTLLALACSACIVRNEKMPRH